MKNKGKSSQCLLRTTGKARGNATEEFFFLSPWDRRGAAVPAMAAPRPLHCGRPVGGARAPLKPRRPLRAAPARSRPPSPREGRRPPCPALAAGSAPARVGPAAAAVLNPQVQVSPQRGASRCSPPRVCATRTRRPPQERGEGRFGGMRERGICPGKEWQTSFFPRKK